jgi:hypothetical protein
VDSATSFVYCPDKNGTGAAPAEQFIPVRPDATSNPIAPGEPLYWQSVQTGRYCRVVLDAGASKIRCDLLQPQGASVLVYTGNGMTFEGRPLVNPGGSAPLYLADAGTQAPPLAFQPARGPSLTVGASIMVLGNSTGTPFRSDNVSSHVYLGAGGNATAAEMWAAYDANDPSRGGPITPGTSVVLKSKVITRSGLCDTSSQSVAGAF